MCLEKIEGAKNSTNMLMQCVDVGKLGYAKPQLVLCSCCYRCCCGKDVDDEEIFFENVFFG